MNGSRFVSRGGIVARLSVAEAAEIARALKLRVDPARRAGGAQEWVAPELATELSLAGKVILPSSRFFDLPQPERELWTRNFVQPHDPPVAADMDQVVMSYDVPPDQVLLVQEVRTTGIGLRAQATHFSIYVGEREALSLSGAENHTWCVFVVGPGETLRVSAANTWQQEQYDDDGWEDEGVLASVCMRTLLLPMNSCRQDLHGFFSVQDDALAAGQHQRVVLLTVEIRDDYEVLAVSDSSRKRSAVITLKKLDRGTNVPARLTRDFSKALAEIAITRTNPSKIKMTKNNLGRLEGALKAALHVLDDTFDDSGVKLTLNGQKQNSNGQLRVEGVYLEATPELAARYPFPPAPRRDRSGRRAM